LVGSGALDTADPLAVPGVEGYDLPLPGAQPRVRRLQDGHPNADPTARPTPRHGSQAAATTVAKKNPP